MVWYLEIESYCANGPSIHPEVWLPEVNCTPLPPNLEVGYLIQPVAFVYLYRPRSVSSSRRMPTQVLT